jgi:hypothetical protein
MGKKPTGKGFPLRCAIIVILLLVAAWLVALSSYKFPQSTTAPSDALRSLSSPRFINLTVQPSVNQHAVRSDQRTSSENKESPTEKNIFRDLTSSDRRDPQSEAVEHAHRSERSSDTKYQPYDASKWKNRPELVHVVFSTDCSSFQDWQSQVHPSLNYSRQTVRLREGWLLHPLSVAR